MLIKLLVFSNNLPHMSFCISCREERNDQKKVSTLWKTIISVYFTFLFHFQSQLHFQALCFLCIKIYLFLSVRWYDSKFGSKTECSYFLITRCAYSFRFSFSSEDYQIIKNRSKPRVLPHGFYLCISNSDPSVFSKRCIFRMKNILSFVFVQFCFLQPSNGNLSIPVDIRQAALRLCSAGYGSLEKSPPQFFLHFLKLVRQKSWILEKTWSNVWTMSWSSKILL